MTFACERDPTSFVDLDARVVEVDAAIDDARPAADASVLDYCPTRIDVFGYSNVLFSGCGGGEPAPGAEAAGFYAPGNRRYDVTLAGRLRARLANDPELVARFGSDWRVRSCAAGGGVLGTFSANDPDAGAACSPGAGRFVDMCTEDPAPVVLLSANNVYDRCHGGTSDSVPDDETAYSRHWASRFDQFVTARAPRALLVSPQHEWHAEQGGGLGAPATCTWRLPAWNRTGLTRWRSEHPTSVEVIDVGDLQEEFQRHHPCCARLGVPCEANWYTGDDADGWVHFGCAGADALEEHWFAALRAHLLSANFSCAQSSRGGTLHDDGELERRSSAVRAVPGREAAVARGDG